MRISVLGGTGYAGAAIVEEAVTRGHDVTSLSRSAPSTTTAGASYVHGLAAEQVRGGIADADVVVGALSAKGSTLGTLVDTYLDLADGCAASGARLIVIGGFGSLRFAAGEPRVITGIDDLEGIPEARVAEGKEMEEVRAALEARAPDAVDWLFVCPAAEFGAYTEQGEPRGTYRTADDVALFDADGRSAIETKDLALAVLDEIERPTRRRTQIHFAY